ncbi:NADH:ubiquinone reductase (Na(+)-transporting) subunit F [Streptomyces sp. H51]|uniref:NADH:ubiquinone reductase (Na(+)-transporting) subunit F n=1 Tax=Streptomyces sp. H51 TaxID=3111770 RepID=UPI002D777DEE|nr:2Fe-2S iron-sulfur cluster-binding protein [Streptomyces sp. H51]
MTQIHRITVEPIGREVECREDQTILDACLRAGVWLPHSCTHGTCATCKSEVLDGEVDHGEASAFALMDFERDEGKALTCCARPRSDVVIEADVDVDEDIEVHPVTDFTGTVTALEEIALDTRRLIVELDRDLAFNPGQYLRFTVPGGDVDRTYSIACPPSRPRTLEFHIRRTPGGRATDGWIFSTLAVGDRIDLSGPYGRFVLRTSREEPAVMVAGGTGLAPLKAMILHALEDGAHDGHLTLYQGARTREWLYDVEFFRALEQAHPDRFRYRPCLSEESAEGFADGLVTDVLAADHASLRGHVGYVCGPPGMVEAALKTLMSKRLFPRDIYREDFFDEGDRTGGAAVRSPLIKR